MFLVSIPRMNRVNVKITAKKDGAGGEGIRMSAKPGKASIENRNLMIV